MEIVAFTSAYQETTKAFMLTIFKEFGWKAVSEDGLNNITQFFHLPNDGFLFIVKQDNKIIGTGGCKKLNANEGLLKRFYIAKEYRGSGISEQLLEKILDKAKLTLLTSIVLDVSKNNKRAIRFYEKNGFTQYQASPVEIWYESSKPDIYNYYYFKL